MFFSRKLDEIFNKRNKFYSALDGNALNNRWVVEIYLISILPLKNVTIWLVRIKGISNYQLVSVLLTVVIRT